MGRKSFQHSTAQDDPTTKSKAKRVRGFGRHFLFPRYRSCTYLEEYHNKAVLFLRRFVHERFHSS